MTGKRGRDEPETIYKNSCGSGLARLRGWLCRPKWWKWRRVGVNAGCDMVHRSLSELAKGSQACTGPGSFRYTW